MELVIALVVVSILVGMWEAWSFMKDEESPSILESDENIVYDELEGAPETFRTFD